MRYLLIAVLAACGLAACSSSPDLPRCDQDRLIHGSGAYEDGRWEYYSCDVSTHDLPTYEQTVDLEKLAECPAVDRNPSGQIAVFDDGVSLYVRPSDGSGPIPVAYFIQDCLR